eukprot:7199511-Lingulodinium_polyedra.AAC.1
MPDVARHARSWWGCRPTHHADDKDEPRGRWPPPRGAVVVATHDKTNSPQNDRNFVDLTARP